MTGRVIKRPQAVLDLDEQAAFLQRESAQVAIRFLECADATFELLAGMPMMGRRYDSDVPDLVGLRSFRISDFVNHLVFYRPIEDGIEVLRVLHGARDIESTLEQELG